MYIVVFLLNIALHFFVESDYLYINLFFQIVLFIIVIIFGNVHNFNLHDKCRVIHKSFSKSYNLEHAPFDIVFLDPPYDTRLLDESLTWLINKELIHEDSLIYIECSAQQIPELPDELEIVKQKKTKTIFYALCKAI